MVWLVSQMWITLGAASLLAAVLGFTLRGIFTSGKLARVVGESRIAQADLAASREEIERLYAAQRRASLDGATNIADPAVKAELAARDQRISDLNADISKLRSELNAAPAKSVSSVPVPAPTLAAAAQPEEPALVWRNRHLESRIKHLEGVVVDLQAAPPVIEAAPVALVADAPPVASLAATDLVDTVEIEKLKWRADYLKTRVAALEGELLSAPATVIAAAPIVEAAPAAEAVADLSADAEELARLRWRNRYLEGRLAYFDGTATEVAAAPTDSSAASVAAAGETLEAPSAAPEALPEAEPLTLNVPIDPRAKAQAAEDSVLVLEEKITEAEAVVPAAPIASTLLGHLERADAEADAREASLTKGPLARKMKASAKTAKAAPEPVVDEAVKGRPLALAGPVDGKPDDLTAIGGIGPKIQDLLNKLGIFHFDQIAAWTPENSEWINNHLDFDGRIQREGWVEQAVILSGEA